jgi:hypothetical protein
VAPFREAKVPLFTFALGNDCDPRLLKAISRRSRSSGEATSYEAKGNREILQQLQEVGWELRQTWRIPVPEKDFTRGEKQEKFSAPEVGPWHDLGVLLWRKMDSGAGKEPRARAPLADDVDGPRVKAARVKGSSRSKAAPTGTIP